MATLKGMRKFAPAHPMIDHSNCLLHPVVASCSDGTKSLESQGPMGASLVHRGGELRSHAAPVSEQGAHL